MWLVTGLEGLWRSGRFQPPGLPYRFLVVDSCPEFGEAISIQRVPDPLATTVALYKTGTSEDLQVM
jgi:hypothetical protein